MGCAGSTASTPTPTATSAVPSGPPFEDRVKNAFAASFDLNGDGVLDIAEVLKFLMLSGQSSVDMEIAQQFMDAFNSSGNGKMTVDEFMAGFAIWGDDVPKTTVDEALPKALAKSAASTYTGE